jgi:hypothetical protein
MEIMTMNTINNSPVTMKKHYINELAYFDSFSGMIPCKVIAIENDQTFDYNKGIPTSDKITIKLTGNCKAYKRGETIVSNSIHIVPRESVHHNKILNNYQWIKE